jgi:hypothetical protein
MVAAHSHRGGLLKGVVRRVVYRPVRPRLRWRSYARIRKFSAAGWLPMIAFACRPTANGRPMSSLYGFPVEAACCRCGDRQRVWRGHVECSTCGRLPEPVIRRTWERQAKRQRVGDRHVGVPALRI